MLITLHISALFIDGISLGHVLWSISYCLHSYVKWNEHLFAQWPYRKMSFLRQQQQQQQQQKKKVSQTVIVYLIEINGGLVVRNQNNAMNWCDQWISSFSHFFAFVNVSK